MHFSWSFEGYVKQAQTPVAGSGSVGVRDASLSALADALDAAQHDLNAIVTCWKDAVGPEHDSNLGRSNAANQKKEANGEDDDDGDNSADDGEDEGNE